MDCHVFHVYPIVFVIAGIVAYMETGAYDVLTPAYLLLSAAAALALDNIKLNA